MSSQNGDQALREELQQKTTKITYTKEFLLSLGALDVCNRLPKGFDRNLLSEFEDTSNDAFERQRSLGGFRPVNRAGSSGGYSRGSAGSWDTRSSGSSDKDGDSHGDQDFPDPRHFGNQPRRSGQQLEQDGLLGSGVFPRSSGYSGTYAPRGRGSGPYQLNRNTEPYQPPRPYKAVPYSRKDTVDSFNDETFGFLEYTSEDKAEEERKRRASFELIRKEQQKALQDKQKQKSQSQRERLDSDISATVLEEDLSTKKVERSDVFIAPSLGQNDSSRLPSSVSRPVVPPGFASATLEKNPVIQSVNSVVEAGRAVIENNISVDSGVEKKISPAIGISSFKRLADRGNMSYKSSGLPEGNNVWEDVVNEKSNQKEFMPEIVDADNGNHSSSIQEKLFDSALLKNSSNPLNFVGLQDDKEVRDPALSQSSKFTHWFLEKEKKPPEDLSSSNLLSLIVSNEKVGLQDSVISVGNTANLKPPSSSYGDVANMHKLRTSPGGPSHSANNPSDKQDINTSVLTCEDLEQLILSEVKDTSSSSHSVMEPWSVTDSKTEEQKVNVDDSASQHLLSLLTKGTNPNEARTSKEDLVVALDKPVLSDLKDLGVFYDSTLKNSETTPQPESVSTLGALFGAAFMNDLHSVRAPLSCQRGPSGSTHEFSHPPHAIPFSEADGHLVYSTHEYKPNSTLDGRTDVFSQSEEAKGQQNSRLWPGNLESSLENLNLSEKDHEEEIRLPEENSLFSLSDPSNSITSDSVAYRNLNRIEKILPKQTVEEFSNPLLSTLLRGRQQMDQSGVRGALPSHGSDGHVELLHPKMGEEMNNLLLNTLFKEGQHIRRPNFHGSSSLLGPIDLVESDDPLRQLHGRVISQLPQQANHIRPPPPQIDPYTNRNPHKKFMGPEGTVHHDLHHSFPSNLAPHHAFPNAGGPQFDPPPLHPLLQQIMPETFAPHHLRQGLPRGLPVANPPPNHMPGFVPEMNNLAGSSFNHRQLNYAGPGVGIPAVTGPFVGAGGGNGHPEALQRLIEMELRANQKQIHPSAGGRIPGVFGPEVDMGFRYR